MPGERAGLVLLDLLRWQIVITGLEASLGNLQECDYECGFRGVRYALDRGASACWGDNAPEQTTRALCLLTTISDNGGSTPTTESTHIPLVDAGSGRMRGPGKQTSWLVEFLFKKFPASGNIVTTKSTPEGGKNPGPGSRKRCLGMKKEEEGVWGEFGGRNGDGGTSRAEFWIRTVVGKAEEEKLGSVVDKCDRGWTVFVGEAGQMRWMNFRHMQR
ncbi:hypothetical protein B0H19DRAFT_1074390 [Mycena capillaripes]|nr:hypothetical protein B0H19DRAFT_1074390 [Mycena capillaripes]